MRRDGFTLVELMITLVLIGMIGGVTSLVLPPRLIKPVANQASRLAEARHEAIVRGASVSGVLDSLGRFTADPAGVVLTDSSPNVRLMSAAHAR